MRIRGFDRRTNSEKLEHTFKTKLENLATPPPAGVFENIQDSLQGQNTSTVSTGIYQPAFYRIFLKYASIAALLAITLGPGFLITKNTIVSDGELAKNAESSANFTATVSSSTSNLQNSLTASALASAENENLGNGIFHDGNKLNSGDDLLAENDVILAEVQNEKEQADEIINHKSFSSYSMSILNRQEIENESYEILAGVEKKNRSEDHLKNKMKEICGK